MTIEFDELEPADGGAGGDGRGRRRVVVGVAAAMLIAAAGGAGYGIGRSVDDDSGEVNAGEVGGAVAADEERSASTVEQPVSTLAPLTEDLAEPMAEGDDSDFGVRSSGGPGYAAFGSQPMETLVERTTDTGFALRVQLGQTWDMGLDGDWGAGDWRPAPWCFESGQLRVAMTGNGVIDVGGVPWYAEPFNGRAVSSLLLGGNDGSPQWVVIVQAPADVTTVRATFADGATDAAAPQGGIAVLTVPGQAPTQITEGESTYFMDPTATFEVAFEGGAEPAVITSDGVGTWGDTEFRASCTPPPPALPEPGEQPADPAAAEAEVRAAMTNLYGAIGRETDGSGLIDDPTGVAEAREQVQAGGFADDAAGASATIDELVFTAPGEAWFRYSIDTQGNDFDNRYGIAVLVDGVWKITRATICQDLSLAGGDCGGGWESIHPPGAFPDEEYITPATTALIED